MVVFKSLSSCRRTGVIASIETYEVLEPEGQPCDEKTDLLFLTRKGKLRECTEKGNKTISPKKAITLTGKTGIEWLMTLKLNQEGANIIDKVIRNGVTYEIDLVQDLEVYCGDDKENEPYQVTELDIDIATDNMKKTFLKKGKVNYKAVTLLI